VTLAITITVNSELKVTYCGITYSVQKINAIAISPVKTLKYREIVVGTPEVTNQQVLRPATA
jgi:hypothetical protein